MEGWRGEERRGEREGRASEAGEADGLWLSRVAEMGAGARWRGGDAGVHVSGRVSLSV